MPTPLDQALDRLSAEQAFALLHAAYMYLARIGDIGSATQRLLHRIGSAEPAALLLCVRKMLEERHEVAEVLAGRPRADGLPPRPALVAELTQMLYWPTLLAVGCGVAPDAFTLLAVLDRGRAGEWPAKAELDTGGDAAAILHRAFLDAGRSLAAFIAAFPDQVPVEPRELALADLRQMAARPYLAAFLEDTLAVAPHPQDDSP